MVEYPDGPDTLDSKERGLKDHMTVLGTYVPSHKLHGPSGIYTPYQTKTSVCVCVSLDTC